MALTDEELREAASHRGLKLVKSRRRKPGVGDYGRFGLTDATGKPLYGIANGRLTASAEEIAGFLRKGEVSNWAASARATPEAAKEARTAKKIDDDTAPPSAIRPRRSERTNSRALPRRSRSSSEPVELRATRPSEPPPDHAERKPRADLEPDHPTPTVSIRPARPADGDEIARLLEKSGFDGGSSGIRKAIAAAAARKEPMLIADRGGVIGLLAWTVMSDILAGAVARITAIVVNEEERRGGVGKALYEAAIAEFGKRKIRLVEAMSDIEVQNANGFFRSIGLKQVSYRFVSEL